MPWLRIRVENRPDLARFGPVVLAPNHVSFLDPPVMQWAAGRVHLTFLMTEVIYRIRAVRWLFQLWGAIPVPKEGSAAAALKGGLAAIRAGRPVVIFPEGGIQDDGLVGEGKGGVVTLIARGQVPVIPVAIIGTHDALPRSRATLRPARIIVRFGEPMDPPHRPKRDEIDAFAEKLMQAIAALGLERRPGV